MIKNYTRIVKALIKILKNWPAVIVAKILKLKIKYLVLKNGLKIYVGGKIKPADLSMLSEIWCDKSYTPIGFEIKENNIVFDIGANNGFFSIYAANFAKNGKVYVFEPFESLTQNIRKSIEINNFKNIIIENKAISESNEKREFYLSGIHNGCHSLYNREGSSEKIIVETVTLGKYCEDNNIDCIDFLKLDCEGAEYEIINEKTISFIKKVVRLISMEYHDDINEHTHVEIEKTLKDAGFLVEIKDGYLYGKNENK